MNKIIVLGIYIKNRTKNVLEVQKNLTEYGCYIKTRLGLHEVDENSCSSNGLLILEMFGDESKINEFEEKIKAITDVAIQRMIFNK